MANNQAAIPLVGPHFQELLNVEVQKVTGRKLDNAEVEAVPLLEHVSRAGDDFHPDLVKNVKSLNYERFTPIQQHAIPMAAKPWDIIGCAQTGSGKTAAFLLPILNKMLEEDDFDREQPIQTCKPVALIIAPTRELVLQIYQQALKFAKDTGIKVSLAYGGVDRAEQVKAISGADVLVGCGNRLRDLMEEKPRRKPLSLEEMIDMDLSQVKYLVLDEADKLLGERELVGSDDSPKKNGVKWLLNNENSEMPPAGKRQTFLFSATFPVEIKEYTSQNVLTEKYVMLIVGGTKKANPNVEQQIVQVPENEKFDRLVKETVTHEGRLLVFVATREAADVLLVRLKGTDLGERVEHLDMLHRQHDGCICPNDQADRERALASLRDSDTSVLIATNVAGRGLDIQGLDTVCLDLDSTDSTNFQKKKDFLTQQIIYYDVPYSHTDYIHGIGRTGRSGHRGKAIVFFDPKSTKDAEKAYWLIDSMQQVCQPVPDWLLRRQGIIPTVTRVAASLRPDMTTSHAPTSDHDVGPLMSRMKQMMLK